MPSTPWVSAASMAVEPGVGLYRFAATVGMDKGDDGVAGGTNHRLAIDFNNMPKGTKTSFQEGGLFKEVKLNRGSTMGLASQDS
jgi:hypothetical protein